MDEKDHERVAILCTVERREFELGRPKRLERVNHSVAVIALCPSVNMNLSLWRKFLV